MNERIMVRIRNNGHRLTNQRANIFRALSAVPKSAAEVADTLLSEGKNIDKATVYRTLAYFVTIGIAAKTTFRDGTAKYERATGERHHHHVVCDRCGILADIPLDERALLRSVSGKTDFLVTGHVLEFFGLCKNCKQQPS